MIDKPYFVAAKLIDLLLEERFKAIGYDIVCNGVGWQFALDLATEGPRALGRDGFDRLGIEVGLVAQSAEGQSESGLRAVAGIERRCST